MKNKINVGMIGYKFMGKAHSHAFRDLPLFFPELPLEPALRMLCGRDEAQVRDAARILGWEAGETDWRNVVSHPGIDLVDVASPSHTHFEIVMEAIRNGKHVLCEKPLAVNLREAREMLEAAERQGIKHMVNFNYRRVPAVMLAKSMIAQGRLGTIFSFSGKYRQDWPLDPDTPFDWRMDKQLSGGGAMSEMGAHLIDLARFLIGEMDEVAAKSQVLADSRPLPDRSGRRGAVTSDDAAVFISQFRCGAMGVFETSRMSAGHKNGLAFEINGSLGSVRFNLERLNELDVFLVDKTDRYSGFRTLLTTERDHPYIDRWWPPGHTIGWEHTFIHQFYELIKAIADNAQPSPSFHDGLKCQEVIAALELAAECKSWIKVGEAK